MSFAPRFFAIRSLVFVLLFLVGMPALAADAPKTDDEKAFYAIGTSMARQLETLKPISAREMDLLVEGMRDVIGGEPLAVEQQEGANFVRTLVTARQKVALENEKQASADFSKSEGAKSGAKTTESGLIYTELKAGDGAQPKATDKVRVHYHGTLRDGTVFDSSVDRGEPAEFPLNRVIPCWTEGVAMMKVGGKSNLICPASIAYGEQGRPGIPGGAALKFEVELLEIVK